MPRLFAAAFAATLVASPLPRVPLQEAPRRGAEQGSSAESIALWQATLVDVRRGVLVPDTTVVIEGDSIVAVQPTATIRLGAEVRRIDATGRYLIPGLWDAHAHLSYWGEDALGRLVAAGVTNIRELGGDPDEIEAWKAAIASGEIVGPSMVWCGPFLEGPDGGDEYRWRVSGPEQATAAAVRLLDRGVDFLKIQPRIGAAEVAALVRAAQRRGTWVVGHVPEGLTAIEASRLGLRSIEHLSPYLGLSDAELQATIEVLLANRTWISPALYSMVAQVRARGEDPGQTAQIQRAYAIVRRLHEAGVPMLVGANFAYRGWPQAPGTSLHGEMQALVQAGVPPVAVLRMATLGNARFSEVPAGVRAGVAANLVLLDANPLQDLRNAERIAAVVLRGRYLDSEALAALVPTSR